MPVALVVLLLDITLIYHASKTGRLQPWAFIILMIPLVGALAYIVVELVPEWFGSPGAQQARKRIAGKLDPEKLYRELSDRLAGSDTIANRAGTCSRVPEDRAIRRSRAALRSHPDTADGWRTGLRAGQGAGRNSVAIVRRTRSRRWTICKSAGRILNRPKAHLLYARSLAEVGRIDEALEEYHAVQATSPARRHGSATACCYVWSAATPRPEWCSTNCCSR